MTSKWERRSSGGMGHCSVSGEVAATESGHRIRTTRETQQTWYPDGTFPGVAYGTIAKGKMGRVGALTGEGGAEQSMPIPFPAFPA